MHPDSDTQRRRAFVLDVFYPPLFDALDIILTGPADDE